LSHTDDQEGRPQLPKKTKLTDKTNLLSATTLSQVGANCFTLLYASAEA
jgi:hypothetical protein